MERGEGMYMWDTDGKKYLDFIQGWAVNCLGHSPKVLHDCLTNQTQLLVNSSPALYNRPMVEFYHALTKVSCFDRVFQLTSGAEANESAIKLARKFGKIKKNDAFQIITTLNAFHGRTLATMSATGKPPWKDSFPPMPEGFRHVPFNDIQAIRDSIDDRTCAVMLELVQGEGGVNVASQEYISELRDLCTKENILLIIDEVQTGFGRTGTLFCYEHYGIEPDILTLGKGIGSGFPLSAMLCKEELNIFEPGDQGGTYTGQPLACSVGLAVLNEVSQPSFLNHVNAMSEYLMSSLKELSKTHPISDVRGQGLLVAFNTETSAPDIAKECMEKGLLVNACKEHSIRLMPALIVEKSHCDQCVDILSSCLKK